MKSKPFHLYLKPSELKAFINFIPTFCLTATRNQCKTTMKLLGYISREKFYFDRLTKTHLRDSYYILLFLVMMKEEGNDNETHRIINKIKFFDKTMEERVNLYFDIHEDKDSLSIGELEEMWNLPFPQK